MLKVGDQFESAYRTLVVACKSDKRWFDLDAVREPYAEGTIANHGGRTTDDGCLVGPKSGQARSMERAVLTHAGAPPLDYWLLDTQDGVDRVLKSMLPEKVCRVCGEPSRRIVEKDRRGYDPDRPEPYSVAMQEQGQRVGFGTRTTGCETVVTTLGWTDCNHNDWRAGVVLDPFDLGSEVGSARYIVADVFEALESLPDNSVDLVFSSPPFLALRSYLPADHPNKAKEIGSEATPADFLDTLLDVVEACDRVLAPHGSLCFELGDSFSGSGGSGGDYADDGWRKGQPRFGGSAAKARESKWSLAQATWLAGVIDTEGSIIVRRQDRGEGQAPSYRAAVQVQMMDPEVVDRCIEITGVGHHGISDKGVYRWHATAQQARYILLNIWPHLLIKQKQAWAAIELMRHMEESERRGKHARVNDEQLAYRDGIRDYVCGLNRRGEERGTFVPMWEPPMPPRIDHSGFSDLDETGWPMPKSLCGLPSLFAASLAYGYNMLRPERRTPQWRIRNLIAWCRPNPPVGALGDKFRPATSYLTVACKSDKRWFDLDAVRTAGEVDPRTGPPDTRSAAQEKVEGWKGGPAHHGTNPAGAPPLDYWEIPTQPSTGEGTSRLVRVPLDGLVGGIQRTTSADCPEHGSQGHQDPSGEHDGREVAGSIRIPGTDARPVPAPQAEPHPTFWNTGQTDDAGSQPGPAATPHSNASSRTAPVPETSSPGMPFAQTAARTEHTSGLPESSDSGSSTDESRTGDEAGSVADLPRTAPRTDHSSPSSACTCSHYVEVDAAQATSDYAGIPPDYWVIPTQAFSGSHYATFPDKLVVKPVKAMCPSSVCRTCGEPRRRITEPTEEYLAEVEGRPFFTAAERGGKMSPGQTVTRQNNTLGWTDCGHNDYRAGVTLDPFAGSGTTLAVATGHGRDAIGVDLDARNAELALERVGPLFLTVETLEGTEPFAPPAEDVETEIV